jgi:hypothetical protein
MSSADAASLSVVTSSSTSGSLSPSSSGTTHVDPPSDLHAPHSTPSTHVPSNSHSNTVDAVLDSPVTDLVSDVGENAFMIVEGESQDGSMDDVGHESVDVQGREGVMVMDNGDDGQQWFPEHENHELKRVKVRLFPRCFSVQFFCTWVVRSSHTRGKHSHALHFSRSMNSSNPVGSTRVLRCVSVNTKMAKQPWSRKRRQTCQRSSSRRRSAPVTCINASKVGRFTRLCHLVVYSWRRIFQIPLLSGQNRMVPTMRSASKILRVAWNCGISYSKCKACARIAVVRGIYFSHFPAEGSLKDQSA